MQLADLFLPELTEKKVTAQASTAAASARRQARLATTRPDAQNDHQTTKPLTLTADELRLYAGAYNSPELDSTYTMVVENENLVVKHARHEDIQLIARDKDEFTGTGSFRQIHFERDAQGRITGLRVSSGRVTGVLFQRQP